MPTTSKRLTAAFPWLFDHLDGADVDAFVGRLTPRRLAEGEVLVGYGKRSDTLYLLPEGGVSVTLGSDAHPLVLTDGAGARLIGDLGVMRPGPASATVTATRAADAFALTHKGLCDLIEEARSPVAARLLLRLAQRIALRIRQGSAVKFGKDAAGQATLQGALAPVDDLMGRIPTALASMPQRSSAPGGKPPADAETRLRTMLLAEPELQALAGPVLDALVRTVQIRACEAGTVLIAPQTKADGAYYLLDGEARVQAEVADGALGVDKPVKPGHLLGQIAFVLAGERSATVTVTRPSTVAVFYSAAVAYLVDGGAGGARAGAHFLHWIAAELADDARELNARILAAWEAQA